MNLTTCHVPVNGKRGNQAIFISKFNLTFKKIDKTNMALIYKSFFQNNEQTIPNLKRYKSN